MARPPQTIASLGETRLIAQIRRWLGDASPPAPGGIGDDCAVLPRPRRGLLVTVDPVIRGQHFDDTMAPAAVAAKLLRRNLSDIAAMGGVPRHAVIALAAPPQLSVAWLRGFYRALGRLARRHRVQVVGGDCAQSDGFLGAFLTLAGDAPARPLTRMAARAGDLVFVSGALGGSILGHHWKFTPRLDEGRWLAGRREVHAAIDVSDGLGKDLPALVPGGLAVVVDPRHLPVSAAARRLAATTGRPALDHALNDGEDYELLFTAHAARAEALIVAWHRRFATPLSCIGRIVPGRARAPRVRFEPPLPAGVRPHGYEHFH